MKSVQQNAQNVEIFGKEIVISGDRMVRQAYLLLMFLFYVSGTSSLFLPRIPRGGRIKTVWYYPSSRN